MSDKFSYEMPTFGRKMSTAQRIRDAYEMLNLSGDGDNNLQTPNPDDMCVTTIVERLPKSFAFRRRSKISTVRKTVPSR